MTAMTSHDLPVLSADAIREAFLREAEADTQMVIRVAEQVSGFQAARDSLEQLHGELSELYRQAQARPNVAAKLAELGLPPLNALTVSIGGGSRPSRNASSARRGKKRTARSADTALKPAVSTAPTVASSGSSAPASGDSE